MKRITEGLSTGMEVLGKQVKALGTVAQKEDEIRIHLEVEQRKAMDEHQEKNVATERLRFRPGKKSPSGTSKTPGFTFFVRSHFMRPDGTICTLHKFLPPVAPFMFGRELHSPVAPFTSGREFLSTTISMRLASRPI